MSGIQVDESSAAGSVLPGWTGVLVRLVSVAMLIGVAAAIFVSRRWPLVQDAPLMHYVVFLLERGRAPYRDIIEMNMPGTYLIEALAMRLFGGDAHGWWLWDSLVGVTALFAGGWIAGRGRRLAGAAGGAVAYLFHLSEGPINFGQRDWIVAVLLLLAAACGMSTTRGGRPRWLLGFSAFALTGALIKPPILLLWFASLLLLLWFLRRNGGNILSASLCAILGAFLPVSAAMIFLTSWRVTGDFLVIAGGLVPWYASLQRLSLVELLGKALPLPFLLVFLLTLALYLLNRSWRAPECNALLIGFVGGFCLFLSQGKGWTYHLSLETLFLSVWAMVELTRALRASAIERGIALVSLALMSLIAVSKLRSETRSHFPMTTLLDLEADVAGLGGAKLSGDIQCLDMTRSSCINVLYRMQLVQSTGFIYDFYLFPKQPNMVTQPLQSRFLREIEGRPPRVIVLSSQIWPGETFGYGELANWPAFETWLGEHYKILKQEARTDGEGYRIYLRRD